MIEEITIRPTAGLAYVSDPVLAYIQPILVSVEGTVFDLMSSAINRACKYVMSAGRFEFVNNFDGEQRVLITYKT